MSAAGPCTLVFVYGTLKRGFANHSRYLAFAERSCRATFLGAATSVEAYPLVVRPLHLEPATCAPVLMDQAGSGHCIEGEVFELAPEALAALDIVEGVARGYYYKKELAVRPAWQPAGLRCTAYFFPATPELLALPMHPCYTEEHHAMYRPRGIDREAAELCQGCGSHGLKALCPAKALVLRLLPGEELLEALQAATADVGAAVVLSCVGSLSRAALRPAGRAEERVVEEDLEIVSLTGTLGRGGRHLHMSVSDCDCQVLGGHVLPGCRVRTTAEVALGLLEGLEFARLPDARTGFRELSIVEGKR